MDKEMEPASSLHGSKEKLVYSDGRIFLKIQLLKAIGAAAAAATTA